MPDEVFLSTIVLSFSIYFSCRDIANAIRNPQPKKQVARNAVGMVKKAEVVKKTDIIDDILKDEN